MADKLGCDEKEKSLYLVQIWYLEEQLERCLLRCDELEKEHQDLRSQYSALEKDKKSVTGKLKCTVAAKQKKAEELAEELEKQQHQTELEREALKLQHRQEVEEVEEQRIQMESDIKTQAVNMEEQKEQLAHVQHHLPLIMSLQEQLFGQRKEHEAEVQSQRTDIEAEKMRAAATLQKTADDSLRTEMCNILREERAQHKERQEWLRFLLGNREPLEREKKILQDAEGEVSVRLEEVGKQLHEVKKERSVHRKLEAELRRERSRRLQLDGVRQEAAVVLRHILTDSARRRGAETQRLLEIVESTAPQGGGGAAEVREPRPPGRWSGQLQLLRVRPPPHTVASDPQYSPEFGQLSLVRKVPVMKDGGFVLTESTAILKYMAQKHSSSVADHWFPAELQQRARVNEYLSWQHMNLRTNGSKVFLLRTLFPIIMDSEAPQEKEDSAVEDLKQSLDLLEQMFLQNKPFIVGDKISLADLVAIVEIMQPVSAGMDAFEGRPKLAAWRARVKKELGEKLFDEAHEAIMNRSALLQKMQNNPQLHLLKPKFQKLFK
ncbi:hypothetical protein INR49_020833 [Caranx melampygus]|nr:hypothetical protein INR49_020833 [Caranx melampygus]